MTRNAAAKAQSPAPAPAEPSTATALLALAASVGPPNPALLAAVVASTDDAALIEEGRRIDTRRILDDAVRLYPMASRFFHNASDADKASVLIAAPYVAIAVHAAVDLQRLREQHREHEAADATARHVLDGDAARSFDTGIARRDQLHDALQAAAGQISRLKDQLAGQVGTAETGEALANGLEALVFVARRWLQQGDAALLGRLALRSIDEGYLSAIAKLAQEVRTADSTARVRPGQARVTQPKLDRADGLRARARITSDSWA